MTSFSLAEGLTLNQAWRQAAEALVAVAGTSAQLEARCLLSFHLGLSLAELLVEASRPMTFNERLGFESLVERRLAHEPVAYLTGEKDFFGRSFHVSHGVLVPRAATETLVLAALQALPSQALSLGEWGVGSGALLCTLLCERPAWHGLGGDVSSQALEVCARNLLRHGLTARAHLLTSSWGQAFGEQSLDALVVNPPYIQTAVIADLDADVREHEPWLALDGGEDGLEAYRVLLPDALRVVKPGGWLGLEIGFDQAGAVAALWTAVLGSAPQILVDHEGFDRIVCGYLTG